MSPLVQVPLDAIIDDLIPRDRSGLDPAALNELETSILIDGLRQPIELMELEEPHEGRTHALLSGLRRLTVYRRLAAGSKSDRYAEIPALIRQPRGGLDEALRLMIEENDIRAEVSPWDQARIATEAVPDFFPTTDAAVNALYRTADRQRRARIRSVCTVVEELGRLLVEPASLSQRQLLRLSAALRTGFTELIEVALVESSARSPATQWQVIEGVLREAESDARRLDPPDPRPGRPRRFCQPRKGLWVRREKLPEGWCLRFTGREATGPLMEDIMDEVERLVGVRG